MHPALSTTFLYIVRAYLSIAAFSVVTRVLFNLLRIYAPLGGGGWLIVFKQP